MHLSHSLETYVQHNENIIHIYIIHLNMQSTSI